MKVEDLWKTEKSGVAKDTEHGRWKGTCPMQREVGSSLVGHNQEFELYFKTRGRHHCT